MISRDAERANGDALGLKGELELLKYLKTFDVNCVYGLEQSRITDFLAESNAEIKEQAKSWLKKNRMLPRSNLTFQVDFLIWKKNHWAALAVEQKNQNGARKILEINKDDITLKAVWENEVREYKKSAKNLFFQCLGESYLGKAYCIANGFEKVVIPVAVVDYEIKISPDKDVNWAYYSGVFFTNVDYFQKFFNDYLNDSEWIGNLVRENPKLAYDNGPGFTKM